MSKAGPVRGMKKPLVVMDVSTCQRNIKWHQHPGPLGRHSQPNSGGKKVVVASLATEGSLLFLATFMED